MLREETAKDETMQILKNFILEGWPINKKDILDSIKVYSSMKDELTVNGELIFKGLRIVVPMAQRKIIKQKITLHTWEGNLACKGLRNLSTGQECLRN